MLKKIFSGDTAYLWKEAYGTFCSIDPTGRWIAYTPLTREVERDGVTNDRNRLSFPSRQNFSDQIGRLRWLL